MSDKPYIKFSSRDPGALRSRLREINQLINEELEYLREIDFPRLVEIRDLSDVDE